MCTRWMAQRARFWASRASLCECAVPPTEASASLRGPHQTRPLATLAGACPHCRHFRVVPRARTRHLRWTIAESGFLWPPRHLRSAARMPSPAAGGRRCRSRAHTRQRPRSDLCFQVSSAPRKARQARGVLSAYAGCARGQYCVQGPRTGQRLRRRVPPARTCAVCVRTIMHPSWCTVLEYCCVSGRLCVLGRLFHCWGRRPTSARLPRATPD